MILEGNIDDGLKATFEQTDADSFQFKVPNGVTGSNTFNKLVIETQQTDENKAFYIQRGRSFLTEMIHKRSIITVVLMI